jgi:DNA-directed RNA polymerase specialized sigma24 family protein
MTDKELVELCCRSPSASEWNEFVRRFRPVFSSAIRRKLLAFGRATPQAVEEHTQQAFLHLCDRDYRALRLVSGVEPAAIRAYLRTLACNLVIDKARSTPLEAPLDESIACRRAPADRSVLIEQLFRLLENCVGEDQQRNRLIFGLYYRTGLTSVQIAQIPSVGLSQKGIESRLLRLSDCIRKQIAEGKANLAASQREGGRLGD